MKEQKFKYKVYRIEIQATTNHLANKYLKACSHRMLMQKRRQTETVRKPIPTNRGQTPLVAVKPQAHEGSNKNLILQ